MQNNIKTGSFAKTMSDTFRLPGETITQFAAEIKKLTTADRDWFKERFLEEHKIKIAA